MFIITEKQKQELREAIEKSNLMLQRLLESEEATDKLLADYNIDTLFV